ncbi:hypothetical protein AVME950_00555 [Acidovorax sp. SUPP950]|uniref:hypothetical protein n=1 Tax=Acidovorax sp. SUPP950 TaxID=511901 RepID=UPI0023D7AC18|nr:hypothetical protein [Acidovorax sp. SUPP950]GKS73329.1 hypothetical protein AVME950_00555 [Acidovorax sp. SUPP950]
MDEQHFHLRTDAWLHEALFSTDPPRAAAASANLRRALRGEAGRDAALIAIGEYPCLTRTFLPRVWSARQSLLQERAAARPVKC